MSELLARKLESIGVLSSAERRAILSLPTETRTIAPRGNVDAIVGAPEHTGVHLIESGFACRYKYLADGRRQILCFLLPGDVLDLRRYMIEQHQLAIAAISMLTLKAIPSTRLLSTLERYPGIARLLWQSTLTEESICQEWLVSMGQRSAIERMAHLLCELYMRLDAVGRVSDESFELPLTQGELADALGLSTVHVNRTLQQLRRQGAVIVQGGRVAIRDIEALKQQALFSPSYLNIRPSIAVQG